MCAPDRRPPQRLHALSTNKLAAVAQAGCNPVYGQMDAMDDALIRVAGAVSIEELDLYMVRPDCRR